MGVGTRVAADGRGFLALTDARDIARTERFHGAISLTGASLLSSAHIGRAPGTRQIAIYVPKSPVRPIGGVKPVLTRKLRMGQFQSVGSVGYMHDRQTRRVYQSRRNKASGRLPTHCAEVLSCSKSLPSPPCGGCSTFRVIPFEPRPKSHYRAPELLFDGPHG